MDFSSLSSSDNILSIVIFLIFMIIVFIIFVRISTALLSYIFSLNGHVKLISGVYSGDKQLIIAQDPSIDGAITVQRSDDKKGGIEFTWSVWLFIDKIESKIYQNVFVKGTNDAANGLSSVNCPGLYITDTGDLCLVINTYTVVNELIYIPDIPLGNWVQVVITCEDKTINVYINGVLLKSKLLIGTIKQNYGNVNVALNGGFSGVLSDLFYWNKTLSVLEIQNLFASGPNTRSSNNVTDYKNKPKSNYLSLDYYI
uniref:LamG-like jellyroll fold domain-containing protein n=1 Tax=viral metagenome TaxID=1070528 RepID=A0A6C0HRP0_9ZZZZ